MKYMDMRYIHMRRMAHEVLNSNALGVK